MSGAVGVSAPEGAHATAAPMAAAPAGSPGLAEHAVSAVLWGAAGTGVRIVMQFAVQVTMARALGPEQIGLFIISVVALGVATFAADIGMSVALVQRRDIDDRVVRYVFTWQSMLGLAIGATMVVTAGPVAAFLGEPRAAPFVAMLSLVCLANAVAAPSIQLLRRRLDFRWPQLAQTLAYFIGYVCVGLPLLWASPSAWAPVTAFVVTALLQASLLYGAVRHSVRPCWRHADGGALWRSAGVMLGTNTLNWALANIDRVVVSRAFSATAAGLHGTAFNLVSSAAQPLTSLLQGTAFATSAHARDDRQRLAEGLLTMLATVTFCVAPVFAGVAAAASTVILALYGPAWLPAAELLAPLALAMPAFAILAVATPLFWAMGAGHREAIVQLPVAACSIALLCLAAAVSLPAVAWTVLAMFIARATIVLRALARDFGLPATRVIRALRDGVVAGLAVAAAVALAGTALHERAPAAGVLVAQALAGGLVLAGAPRWMPGGLDDRVAGLLGRVAARLPARARRMASWLLAGG